MRITSSGFTLIELLVVIAIIALLAMLMMPIFNGVTSQGINVQCQNHLRRIGEAVEGRLADQGARLLEAYGWPTKHTEYLGTEGSMVLACPEAEG